MQLPRSVRSPLAPPLWVATTAVSLLIFLSLFPLLLFFLSSVISGSATEIDALVSRRSLDLFFRSCSVALGATVLATLLGFPLAFLLDRTDLPGRRIFRILSLLPLLIPAHLHAIAWRRLTAGYSWFDASSSAAFVVEATSIAATMVVLALAHFPLAALFGSACLSSIDPQLEESSRLHRGNWETARFVTIPLIRPAVVASMALLFLLEFTDYGVAAVLGVNLYPVESFIEFSALLDPAGAVRTAIPGILLGVSVAYVHAMLSRNNSPCRQDGGETLVIGLGFARWPCLLCLGLLLSISTALPILTFLGDASDSGFVQSFTMLNAAVPAVLTSLAIAVAAASLSVLLGLVIALELLRASACRSVCLGISLLLPLTVPSPLLGAGLIAQWNHPVSALLYDSLAIAVFAHVARFAPFAVLVLTAALRQLAPGIDDAAVIHEPSWARRVRVILMPNLRRSLTAAWLLVYVMSLGELGATLLVLPPGAETLPIRVYNVLHYGADSMLASLSLMLIALGSLPVVLLLGAARHDRRVKSSL